MDYRRTNAIMQEVAQFVKGDFLINDDSELTMAVRRKLAYKNKGYMGGIQTFHVQNMSCTEQCTRENETIVLRKNGIVFGPYRPFPAGNYIASFDVEDTQAACVFTVESQETGVICSYRSSELEKTLDGIYPVEFSLPQKVDQLELKVCNTAETPVTFYKVSIMIPLGRKCTTKFCEETPVISEQPVQYSDVEDSCVTILEDLQSEQSACSRMMRDMGSAAECRLPHDTKHPLVKKIIRKVINSYVFFQVEFNKRLLQQQRSFVSQSKKLLATVTSLWSRQAQQENRLMHIEQQISDQNTIIQQYLQTIEQLRELTQTHKIAITNHEDEMAAYRQMLGVQEMLLTEVKELKNHRDSVSAILEQVQLSMDEKAIDLSGKIKQIGAELQEYRHYMSTDIQQVEQSVDGKVNDLWEKIKRIDDEFEKIWNHNSEVNLNLDSVWRTYNTMRQEVFYEIEHRMRTIESVHPEQASVVNPKVLPQAAQKIALQGGKIRLNLGSGNLPVDGYLSVDARELSTVDIVADVSNIPYEPSTVDEIFSAHLIEHFTRQRMEKELLPYWKSLLKTGGVFRVIFPDLEAMMEAYQAGEISFQTLSNNIMGGQDYQLDYHYAVYSPDIVVAMLEQQGFHKITIVAKGRKNGNCRETEITAVK